MFWLSDAKPCQKHQYLPRSTISKDSLLLCALCQDLRKLTSENSIRKSENSLGLSDLRDSLAPTTSCKMPKFGSSYCRPSKLSYKSEERSPFKHQTKILSSYWESILLDMAPRSEFITAKVSTEIAPWEEYNDYSLKFVLENLKVGSGKLIPSATARRSSTPTFVQSCTSLKLRACSLFWTKTKPEEMFTCIETV